MGQTGIKLTDFLENLPKDDGADPSNREANDQFLPVDPVEFDKQINVELLFSASNVNDPRIWMQFYPRGHRRMII